MDAIWTTDRAFLSCTADLNPIKGKQYLLIIWGKRAFGEITPIETRATRAV